MGRAFLVMRKGVGELSLRVRLVFDLGDEIADHENETFSWQLRFISGEEFFFNSTSSCVRTGNL